jgi:hypothetical protein
VPRCRRCWIRRTSIQTTQLPLWSRSRHLLFTAHAQCLTRVSAVAWTFKGNCTKDPRCMQFFSLAELANFCLWNFLDTLYYAAREYWKISSSNAKDRLATATNLPHSRAVASNKPVVVLCQKLFYWVTWLQAFARPPLKLPNRICVMPNGVDNSMATEIMASNFTRCTNENPSPIEQLSQSGVALFRWML